MPAIASLSAATCRRDVEKFGERLVLKLHRAFHRQVRRVDLEHQSARGDERIFLLHLAGEREDVFLVAFVVRIEHGRGDDAGRGRCHEAFRGTDAGGRRIEQVELLRRGRQIVVADFADRLRRVRDFAGRGKAPRHHREHVGMRHHVGRRLANRSAAESLHAQRHIGLETDAGLLTVVDDVDAGRDLLGHDLLDGALHLAVQGTGVDGFTRFLPHQQVGQRRRPRQAADMRRQDSLGAALHGVLPTDVLAGAPVSRKNAPRVVEIAGNPRRNHALTCGVTL